MSAASTVVRWPATARSPAAPGEREYLLLARKLGALEASDVLRAPRDARRGALSALLVVRMLEGKELKPALRELQRKGQFSIAKIEHLQTIAKALLFIASEAKGAATAVDRATWEDRARRAWTLLVPLYNDVRNASHRVGAPNAPEGDPVDQRVNGEESAARPVPRAHERIDIELDVTLASRSNFYTGVTENLSEGGVFIATTKTKPVGTHLTVKLALPDRGNPIEIRGVVRWVRARTETQDGGLGIHFDALPDADAARIRTFVTKRSPILYGG